MKYESLIKSAMFFLGCMLISFVQARQGKSRWEMAVYQSGLLFFVLGVTWKTA